MKEELGQCLYCMRVGRAKNLTLLDEVNGFKRLYCPRCYPIVKEAHDKEQQVLREFLANNPDIYEKFRKGPQS